MRKTIALVCVVGVMACSDSSRREGVLKKSNELETAWGNLDQEGMAFLDTLKVTLYTWSRDSIRDTSVTFTPRVFRANDSITRLFNSQLNNLQTQYVAYENQLVALKKHLHSFLSWKLLVTNEDIEPGTASNDLKNHREVYDSLSAVMRKSFRIYTGGILDFRNFIQQTTQIKDTVKNSIP